MYCIRNEKSWLRGSRIVHFPLGLCQTCGRQGVPIAMVLHAICPEMFLCKLPIRRVRHWSCLQTPDGSQPRREATHLRQHYNSPCSNIVFTQPPLEPRPKHPMTTSLVEVLYHTSRPQNICYIQYPSGLLYVPFLRETPSHPPAVIPAFTYCCEQLTDVRSRIGSGHGATRRFGGART